MRRLAKIAATISLLGAVSVSTAQAAFIGVPLNLRVQLERIKFEAPVLAPMARVRFCMEYPADCRTPKIIFRGGRVTLTPQRAADLLAINNEVNSTIRPEPNLAGLAGEKWLIAPRRETATTTPSPNATT
jgi:predicted transglutaminase-like cysteine proteinase